MHESLGKPDDSSENIKKWKRQNVVELEYIKNKYTITADKIIQ